MPTPNLIPALCVLATAVAAAGCDTVPVVKMERVPAGPLPSAAPLALPPALARAHWEVATVTPELGQLEVTPAWIVSTPLLREDAEPASAAPSVRGRLEAAMGEPGRGGRLGWTPQNWLDVVTLR